MWGFDRKGSKVDWDLFERTDILKNQDESAEDRLQRAKNRVYRQRELVSELIAYLHIDGSKLRQLYFTIGHDSEGNVDFRQLHGYLSATKAVNATPLELQSLFVKYKHRYGAPAFNSIQGLQSVLKTERSRLSIAARPRHTTASRQALRPTTAIARGEWHWAPRLKTSQRLDPDYIAKTLLQNVKAGEESPSGSRKLESLRSEKKNLEAKMVGRWERQELPFRGKLTKAALGYAFKYDEVKSTMDQSVDNVANSMVSTTIKDGSVEQERRRNDAALDHLNPTSASVSTAASLRKSKTPSLAPNMSFFKPPMMKEEDWPEPEDSYFERQAAKERLKEEAELKRKEEKKQNLLVSIQEQEKNGLIAGPSIASLERTHGHQPSFLEKPISTEI